MPGHLIANPKARLQDQLREVCRFKHMSPRTEEAYWGWVRRFLVFCRDHPEGANAGAAPAWRHPREMGATEVQSFLTHLATARGVAASTQNQALNALVFLYREVLGTDLEGVMEFDRAKRPQRLPVVLTQAEVKRLLAAAQPFSLWQLPDGRVRAPGLQPPQNPILQAGCPHPAGRSDAIM